MLRQQPGCLTKCCSLVTRSSSLCQQMKESSSWSCQNFKGTSCSAGIESLRKKNNYGLVCLRAGHMNHKELLPMVTKSTIFREVSLPTDSLLWPYLMYSYQYFPFPICVPLDTSGRQKEWLGESTICQCWLLPKASPCLSLGTSINEVLISINLIFPTTCVLLLSGIS